MQKTKHQTRPIFSRKQCQQLADKCCAATSLDDAAAIVEATAAKMPAYTLVSVPTTGKRRRRRNNWQRDLLTLAKAFRSTRPLCKIFTEGNSKLPFYSFSTLPGLTCPGAGDCIEWCYSFTAWRYPGAFCRQLQNTLLIKFAPRVVQNAFESLPNEITLRLYVDGDIDSIQTLAFWFRLLSIRTDITAYGYSKSWEVFDAWDQQNLPWPANYRLNLSSGSRYGADLRAKLEQLPITRGQFVAVSTDETHIKGFARFNDSSYHNDVRNVARREHNTSRVFSCPGKCGECLPSGEHACGADSMRGVLIAIAEHN